MPLSMRRQTALENKRQARDEEEGRKRARAVEILRAGETVVEAVRLSGVSRTTCDRIKAALNADDKSRLNKLLDPIKNRAGRRPVISKVENELMKNRIEYAASRGFAFTADTLKSTMAQISFDGRNGFKTESGLPSNDTIRSWRARNRDTTYRKAENKKVAKLCGERYDHVSTYSDALKNIVSHNPGIFDNGDRLWNMDETPVSAEFGRKIKVFGPADTHHGGFRAQSGGKCSKHITALVAVSASGRKTPPLFIVSGKHVMSAWFRPLTEKQIGNDKRLMWLTHENWFPNDAVVLMSENGSMEKRLVKLVVQYINKFVRQFVPPDQKYCLTLDGHSSREGTDWLEHCNEVSCEVVQAPSDTSHFLQPCDGKVNKALQTNIRRYRDMLCAHSLIDLHSIRVCLMLGVIGFSCISPADIHESFAECGLWPMDFRFMVRFEREKERNEQRKALAERVERASSACRLAAVVKRRADADIWADAKKIIKNSGSPSKALQQLAQILKKERTVNSILMQAGGVNKIKGESQKVTSKNEVLYKGTPAVCLTFGELIDARKARARGAEEVLVRKEAQKKAKEQERAQKQAQKELEKQARAAKRVVQKEAKAARERKKQAQKRQREVSKGSQSVKRKRLMGGSDESDAVTGLISLAGPAPQFPN